MKVLGSTVQKFVSIKSQGRGVAAFAALLALSACLGGVADADVVVRHIDQEAVAHGALIAKTHSRELLSCAESFHPDRRLVVQTDGAGHRRVQDHEFRQSLFESFLSCRLGYRAYAYGMSLARDGATDPRHCDLMIDILNHQFRAELDGFDLSRSLHQWEQVLSLTCYNGYAFLRAGR